MAVRYQISGAPSASVICHCTSCRKAHSASAVAWLSIEKSQLQVVSGVLRAFQSSAGVVRHFCELCGTPLAYETAVSPTMIDIAAMSLDNPELYPPTAEIWLEEKLSWVSTDRALDHFRKSSVEPQLEQDSPMTRRRISSGSTFEADIAYSRAVSDGEWVFVSGTTGFDYRTMAIADNLADQTEQALKNIASALHEAGAVFADIVRVTYIVPKAESFSECWPVLRKYFSDVLPAATMLSAGLADARMLIEIDVTARRSP